MSIFDQLKRELGQRANTPRQPAGAAVCSKETFTFSALPETLEQMQQLPEAALTSPFQTAALTVCALCAYGADRPAGTRMLNWLKGPKPLSNYDISFLNDRFRDGGIYVPFSYFHGATVDNDYFPTQPFTVTVESNPYSEANPGYMKLFIRSGGADSPREVVLRKAGSGKWYLWEQYLMVSIRAPKSSDPWA